MSDYTNREIPVLDDIISSPIRTDELLADANISDEPNIQANVQLDIQLDEPVLTLDTHYPPAHNELTDTPLNLINTEQQNSDPKNSLHSNSRIEPALHHPEVTDTLEHEADASTRGAKSFTDNTANDNFSETIENQNTEQQTLTKEYDDSDTLPSGERLYRYVPETKIDAEPQIADTQNPIESTHTEALKTDVSDEIKAEASNTQDQEKVIADTSSMHHDHDSINDESIFKTDVKITDTECNDETNKEAGDLNEVENLNHLNQNDEYQTNDYAGNNVSISASAQQTDIAEHESALIDYQTDVDPYSINEPKENSQTTHTATDDTPQWHDIQQEISGIQAETHATATENLILSTLNNLDTDALTEQVLQNILPNIEQQLRLHIKISIQEALEVSVKQSRLNEQNASGNNEKSPSEA